MAYTILDSQAGRVLARGEWLHEQRSVNVFDWLTEKWQRASTCGIEVGSSEPMEYARVTAISEHKQNPQPTNDHDNKLRDNLGRQYTKTVQFSRWPFAMTLGLDEFEQSKTPRDLTNEATGALGRSTGRLKMDILTTVLSLGFDAGDNISTSSTSAMRTSLRDYQTFESRANTTGIGTQFCTDSDLTKFNVFFAGGEKGLVDPSDVTTMIDNIRTNPDAYPLTFDTLEQLPYAAEARLMESVKLRVNGTDEDVYFLVVPPAIYRDITNHPDRREMQLNAEVKGMANSIFKGRPSFIYWNNIIVVPAVNRVDSWTLPGDADESNYPGHTPLRAIPLTGEHKNWCIYECPLLAAKSYAVSMYRKLEIGESPENDANTKPWVYAKFIYGASKTSRALPDDTERYRCGSVIAAARNGWNA